MELGSRKSEPAKCGIERVSGISMQLHELGVYIEDLSSITNSIYEKLSPVLLPDSEVSPDIANSKENRCPLAKDLALKLESLQEIKSRLYNLSQKIDL